MTALACAATAGLALAAAGCGDGEPGATAAPDTPAAEDGNGAGGAAGTDGGVEETLEPRDIELGPELVAAFRLISSKQTETARARLEQYLEAHPQDAGGELLLGLTFHREKRYALALPHFEAAADLAPRYAPTWHFLGWCLYYLGRREAARDAFERHLAFQPDEGDSHFALGLLDMEADRLESAERRFRRAIELQADNPQRRKDVSKAHARLADLHMRRGRLRDARAELETATSLWPQHYAAFYKLARVLTRLGEPEAADEAMKQYRYWQQQAEARRGVPEPVP